MVGYDILLGGFPAKTERCFLGWSTVVLLSTAKGYALFDTGAIGDRVGLFAALEARSITPEQIETVILSHLHFDHAGNVECFPDAEIILHQDEYFYAQQHCTSDIALSRSQVEGVLRSQRLTVVNGDVEVLPGVRMIRTPGHSGGHCSLVLNLDGQCVVLAQDAVKNRAELANGRSVGAFDAASADASIKLIAEMADVIVPGHDGVLHRVDGAFVPTEVSMGVTLTTTQATTVLETGPC